MRIADIEFQQTAFVAPELSDGVSAVDRATGKGVWVAYELPGDVFAERWYRGAPGSFMVRHALSWRGDDQWEVCEAGREPSVWQEFSGSGAPTVHHVGAYVTDLGSATAELEGHGWKLVQQASGFGLDGDGEFRYFEHIAFPLLAELVTPPRRRRPELPIPLGASFEEVSRTSENGDARR